MNKFFQTLVNVFRIEELKDRIIFTALVLLAVRIGSYIPLPGVDVIALQSTKGGDSNTLFGLYDLFVGGALSNAAIFALGIMPYISCSTGCSTGHGWNFHDFIYSFAYSRYCIFDVAW